MEDLKHVKKKKSIGNGKLIAILFSIVFVWSLIPFKNIAVSKIMGEYNPNLVQNTKTTPTKQELVELLENQKKQQAENDANKLLIEDSTSIANFRDLSGLGFSYPDNWKYEVVSNKMELPSIEHNYTIYFKRGNMSVMSVNVIAFKEELNDYLITLYNKTFIEGKLSSDKIQLLGSGLKKINDIPYNYINYIQTTDEYGTVYNTNTILFNKNFLYNIAVTDDAMKKQEVTELADKILQTVQFK